MSSGIKKSLIALSVSGALIAPSAYATNGYFAHGYSTAEKGLAGAGVAYSHDALASATNPAGLVKVGERLDVGGALFNPNRGYTVAGTPSDGCTAQGCTFSITPGSQDSESEWFFIPHIAYNWMLDDTTAVGIAAYGNGGMNTNYKTGSASVPVNPTGAPGTTHMTLPGVYGAGTTGVNLAQLFINATYAKQIDDKNAVGASLIMAYQEFKASGLSNFGAYSSDPDNLSNKGDDSSIGFGVKLGWQGDVTPDVTLGVSYQSEMAMSEFDDYAGLYAEGGDFDIPATAIIGLAWKTSDRSTLVFDIQQIYYSDVASLNNGVQPLLSGSCVPGDPVNGGAGAGCLGGSSGAGFGWDDMTVMKLGYEWEQNDMTWRVGVSHGDQPISGAGNGTPGNPTDSQVMFNILAPGVIETHLTFGFTMPIDTNAEFTFAGMYAPSNDVSGATQFDPAQTAKLEMDQFEIQGTYTMKF